MELGDLFRLVKKKTVRGPSDENLREAVSEESRLRVAGREPSGVHLFSTLNGQKLFSLPGKLAGTLGRFSEGSSGNLARATPVVTMPLEIDGRRVHVKLTFTGAEAPSSDQPLSLTRASHGRIPPDTQMVELLFTQEEKEYRYLFEFPDGLEVTDFQEVKDVRPIFRSVPAVAQMAAFLRAMANQRRTTLARLGDIARATGTPATQDRVGEMESFYPPHHDLTGPTVLKLHELMRAAGREVTPGALAALAYFADLEREELTARAIQEAAREHREPPLSEAAVFSVKQFFCVEIEQEDWDRVYSEGSFEQCQEVCRRPPFPRIMRSMRQSSQSRTHLDILAELARESKSKRVELFVEKARPEVPEGQFQVNDEQEALQTLLAESGRPVNTNTLSALCLFVDVEVGLLTESLIGDLIPGGKGWDTSLYALVAVAGAFDLPLRGLALDAVEADGGEAFLRRLVSLTGGHLIAQFEKPGERGLWMQHLPTAEDVAEALQQGLVFTGKVLARLPVIDQLNDKDLEVFLRPGKDLAACFAADLDRSLLWHKMSYHDGDSTFIQGFTAYHFNRQVVAQLVPTNVEELLGEIDVVTADKDMRGNNIYRFVEKVNRPEDLQPPDPVGLTWTSQRIVYPELEALPDFIQELGQEPLLGRAEAMLEEAETLGRVYRSLRSLLTQAPVYVKSEELRQLVIEQLSLAETRISLGSFMDTQTREGLIDRLKNDERLEFEVWQPLALRGPELPEYLTFEVMLALCQSPAVTFERILKHFDERSYLRFLRGRLTEMLDHDEGRIRAVAARLMAARIQDQNDRLVVDYELHRARHDQDPAVVDAAFMGLANLALLAVVPVPAPVQIHAQAVKPVEAPKKVEVEDNTPRGALSPRRVADAVNEINKFLSGLQAGDELIVKDRQVARRKEILAAANDFPPEQVEALAKLMEAWNLTVELAQLEDTHTYWCFVENQRASALRGAVLDSWRIFALAQETSLAQLVRQHAPNELFLDYSFFLSESESLLEKELGSYPFLGGAGRPQTIYHLHPKERLTVYKRHKLSSSFVAGGPQEVSPIFLDLMSWGLTQRYDQLRILRVQRAQGVPLEALESSLSSFELEKSLEPQATQILQPNRMKLSPLMHHVSLTREQVGDEDGDWEDFEALLDLFGRRDETTALQAAEAVEEESATPGSPPGEAPKPRPSFRELAGFVTRTFELPEQYAKQVVNILLDVGSQSLYDL